MVKKLVNKFIKSAFAAANLKLERRGFTNDPDAQLLSGLKIHGVSQIFDIGANTGQFALGLLEGGFSGEIVSVEPLKEARGTLSAKAAKHERWTVAPRCVVGDENGQTVINVSKNLVSSSVLDVCETHTSAEPSVEYVAKEPVDMKTLDTLASAYVADDKVSFVKIDTQGFEWQVIKGGQETLRRATGVLCELSTTPLYEGQKLWLEVVEELRKLGFSLWAIQPMFVDRQTGRTLQFDAIFFREGER